MSSESCCGLRLIVVRFECALDVRDSWFIELENCTITPSFPVEFRRLQYLSSNMRECSDRNDVGAIPHDGRAIWMLGRTAGWEFVFADVWP